MKDELHPKYYLPWKDARTHIHLKYIQQRQLVTNTSPDNKNVVYRILFCIVG